MNLLYTTSKLKSMECIENFPDEEIIPVTSSVQMLMDFSAQNQEISFRKLVNTFDVLTMARIKLEDTMAQTCTICKVQMGSVLSEPILHHLNATEIAGMLKRKVSDDIMMPLSLSVLEAVGFYSTGNHSGFAHVPYEEDRACLGLTQFDCVKPIKVLSTLSFGLTAFEIVDPGIEEIEFQVTNFSLKMPYNLQFEAAAVVSANKLRFGLAVEDGVVKFVNDKLQTSSLPMVSKGDYVLLAQDKVTMRWVLHDLCGLDSLFKLSVAAGKFGFKTSGVRLEYQIGGDGLTLSLKNLRSLNLISFGDANYQAESGNMTNKIRSRMGHCTAGYDYRDIFYNDREIAQFKLEELFTKARGKLGDEIKFQVERLSQLLQTQIQRRVEDIQIVNKDAKFDIVKVLKSKIEISKILAPSEELSADPIVEMGQNCNSSPYIELEYRLQVKDSVELIIGDTCPVGISKGQVLVPINSMPRSYDENLLVVATYFNLNLPKLNRFVFRQSFIDKKMVLFVKCSDSIQLNELANKFSRKHAFSRAQFDYFETFFYYQAYYLLIRFRSRYKL